MCSTFNRGLCPEPGRVVYNAVLYKDCFYKVRQFQLYKNSLVLLTHFCKNGSVTDDSHVSFEQCRVVLVVCLSLITNADMVMLKDSLSHYNQ